VRLAAAIILLLGLVGWAQVTAPSPRFTTIDVFIDSGAVPLGAYQVEIKADATLVGVEGGEHPAFAQPPRYDPAALHEKQLAERVVLAAFNTGADLPAGRTRIARLHVQTRGAPAVTCTLILAADSEGNGIDATATTILGEP
jgi:hypothetical protein